MAKALKTLAAKDVPDDVREKYLRRIYDLTTRDDVELLGELGLLDDIDPARGGEAPDELPADDAHQLAQRVEELRREPKRQFFVADERSDRNLSSEGRRRTGARTRGGSGESCAGR